MWGWSLSKYEIGGSIKLLYVNAKQLCIVMWHKKSKCCQCSAIKQHIWHPIRNSLVSKILYTGCSSPHYCGKKLCVRHTDKTPCWYILIFLVPGLAGDPSEVDMSACLVWKVAPDLPLFLLFALRSCASLASLVLEVVDVSDFFLSAIDTNGYATVAETLISSIIRCHICLKGFFLKMKSATVTHPIIHSM